MEAPKLRVWPFILCALLLAALSGFFSFEAGWWALTPAWQPVLAVLLSLLFGALLVLPFWFYYRHRKLNQPSEEELAARRLAALQKQKLIRTFDRLWQSRARTDRGPYDTPWYLMLGNGRAAEGLLLQQMGFEAVTLDDNESDSNRAEPIRFWNSDRAVLVTIDASVQGERFSSALATLLQRLLARRPRQAANGILALVPVSRLLNAEQDQLAKGARRQRQLLREISKGLGLNLPVYSVVTEMAELRDFCQSFSTMDEHRLEEPFGAMMPVKPQPGFDPEWFSQSFSQLQARLAAQLTPALKAQLNADYRDSILLGPYQFGLLQTELESYFHSLFDDNQFDDQRFNFRGYFFVNAAPDSAPVDRLSLLLASELGYASAPVSEPAGMGRSLFVKKLLRRDILAESGLVGVNKRRERSYTALRMLFSGGLAVCFVLFVWLLKANFDYYQALDNRAVQMLDRYKENLLASRPNPDELAAPIFSLSELRDISLIYQAETPWYVVSWLPDPGVGKAARVAYQRELQDLLLITMRDYLYKDLYVYNKLDDKVKTLELYNLQQLLYSSKRKDPQPLTDYYVESLKAEGEGDVAMLQRFRLLLTDLFRSGAVPPQDDQALIQLVKASLSAEDISDLLYKHIMQQPQYARRVDMRGSLGQSYRQLFDFSPGFGGYLVPYAFTREGFQQLLNDTGFDLASTAIRDYQGVIDRISGEAELNRINRKLRQRYTEEYIGYWQRFAANTEWVTLTGWADSGQQLALVADPIFSPLKRLYSQIGYHTELAELLTAVDEPEKAKKQPKVKGKVGAKAQGQLQAEQAEREEHKKLEQLQSRQKMVDAIALPFSNYHKLVKPDDTGQSQLDLVTRQVSQTLAWLKLANGGKSREQFFLDQLAEVELVNPLAQLSTLADSYDDHLLQSFLRGSAEHLNQLALADVRELLNKHWHEDVISYYDNQLGAFYPFTASSDQDVSLKAFKGFFGPKGRMNTFVDKFIVYFNARDNSDPVLNSFLPGQFLALDERFWSGLTQTSSIQSTFFTAEKLGLKFAIRAQSLSSGLTEFALRNDMPLYRYRNGPSLWKTLSWPDTEVHSKALEMQVKGSDRVLIHQDFPGIWNWFRLAEALNGSGLQESTTSSLEASRDGESARLLLRVDGDSNPFISGYFAQLQLPEQI
ncbi:type VI secretion system membrane subunit TssM [Marinobacterium jannaschii]|uniref:type VI secretion system membrane subunit TssM n=1 Tax=Marinobacterium jannaschii TaxID=64970 RepID=UPI0006867477|nr:type VI secretion system membrane subunit TssM [Marinobacterium jannaschii]